MQSVLTYGGFSIFFRWLEKIFCVDNEGPSATAFTIIISFIDFVLTAAMLDEDLRSLVKAYKTMQEKQISFFEAVEGERVLSSFIVASSIVCKVLIWVGIGFVESIFLPITLFGLLFLELCVRSNDIEKFLARDAERVNAQTRLQNRNAFQLIIMEDPEVQYDNVQRLSFNYCKILAIAQTVIRICLWRLVTDTQDLWSLYVYTFLDALLLYPIMKDFAVITRLYKSSILFINLASFILYLNARIFLVLPLHIITLLLIYKLDNQMLVFAFFGLTIPLNQGLAHLLIDSHYQHLHFLVKLLLNIAFLLLFMIVQRPGRFQVYAKYFKFVFQGIIAAIIVLFIFEIEYYEEGNQFLLENMMKDYALLIFLLCLELVLFVRVHLFFGTPKLKVLKARPHWNRPEEQESAAKKMVVSAIVALLNITWKEDYIVRGQIRRFNNYALTIMLIAFNTIFFKASLNHVLVNLLIINRWVYLIKGINDGRLYITLHFIYLFHFFSRDLLSEGYVYFLNNVVAGMLPWKRNLTTILALNFQRSARLMQDPHLSPVDDKYFIYSINQQPFEHLHVQREHIVTYNPQELFLLTVLFIQLFLQTFYRKKFWKQWIRTIKLYIIPLWVYIIYFVEFHFLVKSMLFLHIFQALDEQFLKEKFY